SRGGDMNPVAPAIDILRSPRAGWRRLAAAPAGGASLYVAYVIVLAVLPGASELRWAPPPGLPVSDPLPHAASKYAFSLLAAAVLALLSIALARPFGGEGRPIDGLRLAAFSQTPSWLGWTLAPWVSPVFGYAGFFYSVYLFYVGAAELMRIPPGT